MQKTTAVVDRQATSLLGMTLWSNIVVSALLLIVNAVNLYRAEAGKELLISLASPEVVLILSLALCVWMAYGCVGVLATKRRLSRVYISCSEEGVEGVSMPNPTNSGEGEPFQLAYDEIRYVGVAEVPLTKKGTVPSLKLSDEKRNYVVPAPEKLEELVREIADRISGGSPQS